MSLPEVVTSVSTHSRVDELLHALQELSTATTADQFEHSVLRATVATIDADSTSVVYLHDEPRLARSEPYDFFGFPEQMLFDQVHRESPWVLATHTRDDNGQPLQISDVLSQRQYRSQAIYRELFRSLEIDHQVAFSVPLVEGASLCVIANRSHVEFSPSEIEGLNLLQATLRTIGSQPRPGMQIQKSSKAGEGTSELTTLTTREKAVLALVASGSTNVFIGFRLGISDRTVNKHLEHIFTKLKVANRTEAAAVWHEGH